MKRIAVSILLLTSVRSFAQEPLLGPGSRFPDLAITNISNAPVKEIYLNRVKDNKFYILNFWGTWCSPCIPEMDSLAGLQKRNASKLQVIAISDDSEKRKANYLRNKPSTLWLATDTNYTLYKMLNLAYVGQSAIVNPARQIVAVVSTDSINQQLIDRLLRGDTIRMSAGLKETAAPSAEDIFGLDSLMEHSFTICGYKKGRSMMGRIYRTGPFAGRRVYWINMSIGSLYRAAYGITSYKKQEFYEGSVTEQEVYGAPGKTEPSALYCVDLVVRPGQKDSLYQYLQQYLNHHLPVKARLEKRKLEVYVLTKRPDAIPAVRPSTAEESTYSFSGRGYEGVKVTLASFAKDYLTNELGLPVVDETGLSGYFDITTTVDVRTAEGVKKSIDTLGLMLQKAEREVDVIVYFK